MTNIKAIVLAAGKGKRMKSRTVPKVLKKFHGRPLISYLLKTLKEAGFERPIIVVGFGAEKVQRVLGEDYDYVEQKEQLGTGHAAACAIDYLKDFRGSVLVMYGDMPFWRAETITRLVEKHHNSRATLALISVVFENPSFYAYGRIIRGPDGQLQGIVEEKFATDEVKKIKECNSGCYLIQAPWLKKALKKIRKNESGEYYLTDLVEIAVAEGKKVAVLKIEDWRQAIGINTAEQLRFAHKVHGR